MAALSRRLTAPGVGASMRTPSGPNVSAALFPELTSETSAAQWGQGHRVRAGVLHMGSQLTHRQRETDFERLVPLSKIENRFARNW
jgi:hypothetical protein